jgi:RHS repeat-associated protein
MRSLRLVTTLWLFVLSLVPVSFSQVATGTPPFSSVGGGPVDSIDLGNLNVHFAIPLVNKAGRRMPFTYTLSTDSSVWTPVTSGASQVWQPAPNWGWRGDTEIATGYLSNTASDTRCAGTGIHDGRFDFTSRNFIYHDPFGTQHPFGGTAVDGTDCPTDNSHDLNASAADGSGYKLFVSGGDSSSPQTITTRSGQVSIPPSGGFSSGSAHATDANGNQISVDGSGNFTDTLGTPVLSVSGSGTSTSPKTFTYTGPSGPVHYTMNFTNYNVKTNFACSGISEYTATSTPLVSSIVLPDGSQYSLTYEPTPSNSGYVTGRVQSITIPTGGSITYTYTGGSNGITCVDGSTSGLTRVLSPGGNWTYTRAGSGSTWTTTILDATIPANQTTIYFEEETSGTNFHETGRLTYQGNTPGTLLSTTFTCYNGTGISTPSSCSTTAVASPISRVTVFSYLPDATGVQTETDSTYDAFGLINEIDSYNYGNAAVGSLASKTITAYTALGNGIVDRPSSVTIKDASSSVVAFTSYGYDETPATGTVGTPQHVSIIGSRGNLTSVAAQASSSIALYRKFSYYDTGLLNTSTDVSTSSTTNGPSTTYNYASGSTSCGNSFVTSISEPLSLTRSMTWDCNGGVLKSLTDENGNPSSVTYTDAYFWRPHQSTDLGGNATTFAYPNPNQSESILSFNSGNSVIDILNTADGLGRMIFTQQKKSPTATLYDTTATCYDISGRTSFVSLPYSTTAAVASTPCPGNAGISATYDALDRTASVTDSAGGTKSYTYAQNDVYQSVGPAPTGENAKRKQSEYDALGRLTSVCEVTSGTSAFPGGSCAQNVGSYTGYWTKYTYDLLNDLTGVAQNAQASSGVQLRSYVYDQLGRLASETNPETNNVTINYYYDKLAGDPACGNVTSAGDKVKRSDAATNASCYGYDSLHRLTSVIYPSTSTPAKHFVYDAATVSGTAMSNAKTRMAEAYTCTGACTVKITDLGFSYSLAGQTIDVWESTPHSGTPYYHTTSAYWPDHMVNTISGVPGLPTITYGVNGEGRVSTVSAATGANPITSTFYNSSGQVTALTYGSSDNDGFTYDPNTGRMTKYTYNVGSTPSVVKGMLTWNAIGTLKKLVITDPLDTGDAQTCNYSHDDMGRIASSNCGTSIWNQNFSYDPFGNITKTVPTGSTGISFQPTYDTTGMTNRITSSPFTYDSMGDLTADNSHSYTWDVEGRMITVDSGSSSGLCLTYDALARMVEQAGGSSCSSSYQQILYGPSGEKVALMNAQTMTKAFISLPSGAEAVYTSSGLAYYRHSDWLGSSRLATTSSRTLYYGTAYAAFGENYAGSGAQDLSFTGQNQDTAVSGSGGTNGLYDFFYREHTPVQGRWLSPDPAGLAAAKPNDPQTWNRYAYVNNNPLSSTDPLGLYNCPECRFLGYGGGSECNMDGVSTPCDMVYVSIQGGGASQCPNNDCSVFGNYTGSNGKPYSLVPGVNGPVWVNGSNGMELDPEAAAEVGLVLLAANGQLPPSANPAAQAARQMADNAGRNGQYGPKQTPPPATRPLTDPNQNPRMDPNEPWWIRLWGLLDTSDTNVDVPLFMIDPRLTDTQEKGNCYLYRENCLI